MATLSIRATAGNSTKVSVQAGQHTILMDEPPLFGGENTAPSPVETFLAALAGAINAIGQHVAGELSMTIHKMDIAIDGDCDGAVFLGTSKEGRAGFSDIRISIALDCDGDAATVAAWEEQVRLRCPVLDNLRNPASVSLEMV